LEISARRNERLDLTLACNQMKVWLATPNSTSAVGWCAPCSPRPTCCPAPSSSAAPVTAPIAAAPRAARRLAPGVGLVAGLGGQAAPDPPARGPGRGSPAWRPVRPALPGAGGAHSPDQPAPPAAQKARLSAARMRRFERYPEKPLAGLHPDPVVLLSSGAKPSWSQRSAQPARLCPEFARDAAGLGHQLRRRSCRLVTCPVTSSLPA